MKPFIPLICLMAIANISFAGINSSDKDYLQGHYFHALQAFMKQPKIDSVEAYYLGRMNLYGYGQLKNNDKALRYFTTAAMGGFLPAQAIMARYELLEKKNLQQAFYWFKKSADASDLQAQMYCAAAYLFGLGVNKNEDKAREYYIAAARQGNSIAQSTLAEYFLNSRHGENKKLGLIWLEKALAQNDPKAQLLMSRLSAEGKLVPKNNEEAERLLAAAVAQGYAPAMMQQGDLAWSLKLYTQAKEWYQRAIDTGYLPAHLAMSSLYLDDKSPLYNQHDAYLSILKAAEANLPEAQLKLAEMYKTGKIIEANPELANEWQRKATSSAANHDEVVASQWLSNGRAQNFVASGYHLQGIFVDWKNPMALKENSYNPAPQLMSLSKNMLYKPDFTLVSPNAIAISEYYDALATSLGGLSKSDEMLMSYPLDDKLKAIQQAVQAKDDINVNALLDQLRFEASLGINQSQFDLGQVYQYGIGVQADTQTAVQYYQQAAALEYLPSMYALGLLYLEGKTGIAVDYNAGLSWLRDAAFKGNTYAQYGLARIYEEGIVDAAGKVVVKPDATQSESMYFLAAADGNGHAQYRLAEILVRKQQALVSVEAKQARQAMIKSLYQGAVSKGIVEAALPLAFFEAMDPDTTKQAAAFKVAKKEAEAGHANAALLLGLMYERGIGVLADAREAVRWYQQAGDNPVSQFILGTLYSTGSGVAKDPVKGLALLKQSAAAGFAYANLNEAVLEQQQGGPFLPLLDKALAAGNSRAGLLLADYYLTVASSDSELKQARDIYQLFADKGDKEAQLKLGFMYEKGIGGAIDPANAEKCYTASAEQGQSMAQYLLGRLYQLGALDGKPDYTLAKQWYSRAQSSYDPAAVALGFVYETVDDDYQQAQVSYLIAADHNNPVAAYNQGLIYELGKGQAVDFDKARTWYQQAAKQGHAQAMVRLAGLYFNEAKDPQQALQWYKVAADKGDRQALYQLGLLSETGIATKLDYASARNYYLQSAERGDQQAMLAVARMYQYGIGVAKNSQEAVNYYRKLAELGNAFAQYQLASFYEGHLLSGSKPSEGKQWLEAARANGSRQAESVLQWLAAQNQGQISYLAPIRFNSLRDTAKMPVELMYLEALNQWNSGDELQAKHWFDRIHTEHPNYIPAKRVYEQMRLGRA